MPELHTPILSRIHEIKLPCINELGMHIRYTFQQIRLNSKLVLSLNILEIYALLEYSTILYPNKIKYKISRIYHKQKKEF